MGQDYEKRIGTCSIISSVHCDDGFSGMVHAGEYVIGEGDTLMVSVWGEKDLTLSVKVRPDGKITVPAMGE